MNSNATWIILALLAAAAGAAFCTYTAVNQSATSPPATSEAHSTTEDPQRHAVSLPRLIPLDESVTAAVWETAGSTADGAVQPVVFQPPLPQPVAAIDGSGPRLASITVVGTPSITWPVRNSAVIRVTDSTIRLDFERLPLNAAVRIHSHGDPDDVFRDGTWTPVKKSTNGGNDPTLLPTNQGRLTLKLHPTGQRQSLTITLGSDSQHLGT